MSDGDTFNSRGTVVYIGGFELPDRNAAAFRVRGNARILRDLGFRVVLLGISREMGRDEIIARVESGDEGIEAWQIPYPTDSASWFNRMISARPLDQLCEAAAIDDLAIAIFYNYRAIAQWRMARAARRRGAKAVADITEWYDTVRLDGPAAAAKNFDTWFRMHGVGSQMDGLITTSPFISDFYRPSGLPIVELPTIIPLAGAISLPPPREHDRKQLFFAGTGFEPTLVSKGKDGLKDRLDWVIELLAVAKHKGARFTLDMFGVTKDDYLSIVPAHAAIVEDLIGELAFHGRVPHHELLERLSAADFSIFMRRETRVTMAGFPGKFAEAISYGTPVICSASPSLRRWMAEGRNGFRLDYDEFEKAADKLTEILSMSADEIRKMKLYCASSQAFQHHSFLEPVEQWCNELLCDE